MRENNLSDILVQVAEEIAHGRFIEKEIETNKRNPHTGQLTRSGFTTKAEVLVPLSDVDRLKTLLDALEEFIVNTNSISISTFDNLSIVLEKDNNIVLSFKNPPLEGREDAELKLVSPEEFKIDRNMLIDSSNAVYILMDTIDQLRKQM